MKNAIFGRYGVIMYIFLSARQPFGGQDGNDIMERVATGVYDL